MKTCSHCQNDSWNKIKLNGDENISEINTDL